MSLPAAIGLPRPRAAVLARLAWLALPAIATLALAAEDGGSQTGDWMPWALVAVLSAGAVLAFDIMRLRRGLGLAALGCIAGLAVWSGLSVLVGLAAGRRRHRSLAHALLRLGVRDRAARDPDAARRRHHGRADRDRDRPRHALRLRPPRPGRARLVDDLQPRRLAHRLPEHVRLAGSARVLDTRGSRRRAPPGLAGAFARAGGSRSGAGLRAAHPEPRRRAHAHPRLAARDRTGARAPAPQRIPARRAGGPRAGDPGAAHGDRHRQRSRRRQCGGAPPARERARRGHRRRDRRGRPAHLDLARAPADARPECRRGHRGRARCCSPALRCSRMRRGGSAARSTPSRRSTPPAATGRICSRWNPTAGISGRSRPEISPRGR